MAGKAESSAQETDESQTTQTQEKDEQAALSKETERGGETPEQKAEREEAEKQAREEKDKEFKAAHTKWSTHGKRFEEEAEEMGMTLEEWFMESRRLAGVGYQYESEKLGAGGDGDKGKGGDQRSIDQEINSVVESLAGEMDVDPKSLKSLVDVINTTTEKRIMDKLEPHFGRNLQIDLGNKFSQFVEKRKAKDPNFAVTPEMKIKLTRKVADLVKESPGRYDDPKKNVYGRAFLDLIDDDDDFVQKTIAATKASEEKRKKAKDLLNVDRGTEGKPGGIKKTLGAEITGKIFPQAVKRKQERG